MKGLSRGLGRVFRRRKVWWWDYTVHGCMCGACDAEGRHRESSHKATMAEAVEEMKRVREERLVGRPPQTPVPTTLAAFAAKHIREKRASKRYTPAWLAAIVQYLQCAKRHFGAGRRLDSITPNDVAAWSAKLQDEYAAGTVLHHLGALSNMFKRARKQSPPIVPPGYDPVGDFDEKPTRPTREAKWLEVHDAALLVEAARRYMPQRSTKGGRAALPFVYELVATFLLTGGRESEVLGLEVSDVSFDRKTVTFRPNDWRRLKTKKSHRVVPLWPQLEEILRPYVFSTDRPPSKLLFPSWRTGGEAMVTDFRKLLDAVAERAGWEEGDIRSKQFRHTYITARLQTLDRGAPVSAWTVAREVGHTSTDMIEETYGHLGDIRHRAEVVEYRVSQHSVKLAERLTALACAIVTAQNVEAENRKSLRVASSAG